MVVVIEKIMDWIAINVLKAVFLIIFFVGLFVKAMYSFDDSPYFTNVSMCDIIMGIVAFLMATFIYKKRAWLQENLNCKLCFGTFLIVAVVFILLVPLTPFSDMASIWRGALNFSQFKWYEFLADEYWNVFPGNILLACFWGFLLIPLPKSIISLKIINALMIYAIIAVTRELAKILEVKYYNVVYIMMLTFSPMFLYINHVYYDAPVILLCMLAIYLYKKNNWIVVPMVLLGLAKYLRDMALVFFAALVIVNFFDAYDRKNNDTRRYLKSLARILVGVIIFACISKGLSTIVNDKFVNDNFQRYPAWNQYYIGINETEFGFMDNDFSYDRSFEDVVNRVKEYGPAKMTKILIKKTFWLWSQGTYQAQRYAFGSDVSEWSQKFDYETILTGYLLSDNQVIRRMINSFMRAQYYVFFGLMIFAMWREKNAGKFRLLYYVIIATFLIMLVYELKSRYILQLLPFMSTFAGKSIDYMSEMTEKKKLEMSKNA